VALGAIVVLVRVGLLPRPRWRPLDRARWWRVAVLGLLGGTVFSVAVNLAVALSGPTITGFVAVLYAVLATVFAVPLLGEPAGRWTVVSLALACGGAVLLIGLAGSTASVPGVVSGLIAATSYALYLVLGRRWLRRHGLDAVLVTLAILVGRGPVLLAVELLRGGTVIPADPRADALLALAFLALGPSTVSQLLLLVSMRRVAAARTAAALLLTPVTSAIVGFVLLGETLTSAELAGAMLLLMAITSAVVATQTSKMRGPVADPA
jgi:probable blue pigment (indigoidine) exporter